MRKVTIPPHVDVLVVGSGPIGAAFAREIHELAPHVSVLVVEAGPQLTATPGVNLRNLDLGARRTAQDKATAWTGQYSSDTGRLGNEIAARPGTFLLRRSIGSTDTQTDMPAAAMSANVGGMGAHWTCACPKPGDSERIDFLGEAFDIAFERAKDLLAVTSQAFPETGGQQRLQRSLSVLFDGGRPPERRVQPMPLACTPNGEPLPSWSGVDTILGLSAQGTSSVQIVAETVCVRLVHDGARVRGADLVTRRDGGTHHVDATAVVVAADALRTPQLLWASGIRPNALGRYLNDQPQIVSALALREHADAEAGAVSEEDRRDRLTGVLWIPYHEPDFPFHTQVMQIGTTPIDIPGSGPLDRPVVTWGRFTTKDIRAEDRVEFSETAVDDFGLPEMRIHYGLSAKDEATIARAMKDMVEQARAFGDFFPGSEPRLLPAGSSLHYQGTVRMGESNDGTSVCDQHSRVWGFSNLYVGGNGVIPTATACNPTATSVALAVLAARHLVASL